MRSEGRASPCLQLRHRRRYAAHGALSSYKNAATGTFTGIEAAFRYNSRLQPQDILVTTATPNYTCATGTGKLLHISYIFNPGTSNNGNVASITSCLDADRTQTFSYDELNRVKTAGVPTNWGLSFDYDPWGNLLAQNVTQGSAPSMAVSVNIKNQVIGYGFDAAGSRTSNGSTTYTYDAENRLKTTGGVTYTYDGDGRRVKKSNGKIYWYSIAGEVLTETDLAGVMTAEYVFFGGKRVARRLPDNAVHYYYSDHLGSTSLITNNAGLVKVDSDFYPFGGERSFVNTLNNRYKFTGKERDTESDLDYFGARYYGSALGRFLSPDEPFADQDEEIPQSWNLYTYVRNNPLNHVDLSGRACQTASDGTIYDDLDGTGCIEVDQATDEAEADVTVETEGEPVQVETSPTWVATDNGAVNPGFTGPFDVFFFRVPQFVTGIVGRIAGILVRGGGKAGGQVVPQVVVRGTKQAVQQALESGAVSSVQKPAVKSALRRAGNNATVTVETLGDGSVRVTTEVVGRAGGRATYEKVVDAAGRTVPGSVVQKAYDSTGALVHEHVKR